MSAALARLFSRSISASGSRRQAAGFTLVESMVCVSITAILAAAGVPSLSKMMEQQAVLAEVAEFEDAVHRARSESISRGEPVTLCARDAAAPEAAPVCARSGKDWTGGWLLYVDRDTRGQIEATDVLLAQHRPHPRVGAVNATLRYITFQSLGISASAASHFQFRPQSASPLEENPSNSLLVCVNKPGRTRVLKSAECA